MLNVLSSVFPDINSTSAITATPTILNTEDTQCLICNENFEPGVKITLGCKHQFCYECLLESYRGTACNFSIQKTHRICPYCRTPASYLPLMNNMVPIKGIHKEYGKKCNTIVTVIRCTGILKSGKNAGSQCTCKVLHDTPFCGRHTVKK